MKNSNDTFGNRIRDLNQLRHHIVPSIVLHTIYLNMNVRIGLMNDQHMPKYLAVVFISNKQSWLRADQYGSGEGGCRRKYSGVQSVLRWYVSLLPVTLFSLSVPQIFCMTGLLRNDSSSQEEWTKLRESVPYVKIYRYNPKHLYPKLNGYGDNGQRSLKL